MTVNDVLPDCRGNWSERDAFFVDFWEVLDLCGCEE